MCCVNSAIVGSRFSLSRSVDSRLWLFICLKRKRCEHRCEQGQKLICLSVAESSTFPLHIQQVVEMSFFFKVELCDVEIQPVSKYSTPAFKKALLFLKKQIAQMAYGHLYVLFFCQFPSVITSPNSFLN